MSEKTEQPTAKRLRESRQKGEIARSRLFSSSVVTFAGLAGLFQTAPMGAARMRFWAASLFLDQHREPGRALAEGVQLLVAIAALPLGAALLAALATSVATAGFQFQPNLIVPNFERIDPSKGIKKLFSLKRLAEVGKGMVVAAIIAVIAWNGVRGLGGTALRAVNLEGGPGLLSLFALLRPLIWRCAVVLAVAGCGDYALARRSHRKSLMMTREEVKRERKESNGDPHHKAKRKSLHRQLALGGAARGVQKATAVVVNPTHIAVALRYDADECEAPYLVAKGRETDAFAIRREAQRLGIPVVKDIPLARSLIHYDVGEQVPEELYRAAAAVLKVALDARDLDDSPKREMA